MHRGKERVSFRGHNVQTRYSFPFPVTSKNIRGSNYFKESFKTIEAAFPVTSIPSSVPLMPNRLFRSSEP